MLYRGNEINTFERWNLFLTSHASWLFLINGGDALISAQINTAEQDFLASYISSVAWLLISLKFAQNPLNFNYVSDELAFNLALLVN